MTKTSLDVTTEALRHIGVTAVDETPEAGDHARAQDHLDSIYETLSTTQELAFDWKLDSIPEAAFLPLSMMVAGSIAPAYGRPQYASEYKRGLGLIREYALSDVIVKSQPVRATYF